MRTPRTTSVLRPHVTRDLKRPWCMRQRGRPRRRRSVLGSSRTTHGLRSSIFGSVTRPAWVAGTSRKLGASVCSTHVYSVICARSSRDSGRRRTNRHETLLLGGHGGEDDQRSGALITRSGSHNLDPPTWRAKDVVRNEHLWDRGSLYGSAGESVVQRAELTISTR